MKYDLNLTISAYNFNSKVKVYVHTFTRLLHDHEIWFLECILIYFYSSNSFSFRYKIMIKGQFFVHCVHLYHRIPFLLQVKCMTKSLIYS